jgi:iron complex outermembrane receptor protein
MKSGIILFFTLFLLSANFASAQGAGSGGELEEIIVTAERRAESIQSVSVAVSAIDSAAIESRSIGNLLDVGRHVPNAVIVNGTGPANSSRIFIRGIGEDDSRNPDPAVGTYLDGVFLGRTIGGLLEAVDIAQIEVLRGPQGTMFGRNSNGGAVRVFSVGPQDEDSMSLTAGLGSDGRKMAKAVLNFQVSDDTAVRIAGMQKERDAFVTLKPNGDLSGNARDAGDKDINVLRASLRTNFSEDWSGTFTVDQVNDKSDPVPASIIPYNNSDDPSVVTDADQNLYTAEPTPGTTCSSFTPAGFLSIGCFTGYRSDVEMFGASARIEGKIGDLDFMSLTAHRTLEDDASMFVSFPYQQKTDQEQLSQEFTISSNYDGPFNFVAGMYYWEEEVDFEMTFIFLHTSVTETESLAFFAQGAFALTDELTFVGGVRYTDETRDFDGGNRVFGFTNSDSIDMTNETYTAKLEYQASDDIFMYLSLATGFKTPGFSPDCFGPTSCMLNVAEEEVTSFEAGIRSDLLDGRMRFNATAFYSEYDDLQVGATVPGLGFTRFNLNSAIVQGLEVEAMFKPTDNLEIFGNLGLNDGEYDGLTELQAATITVNGATCSGGVPTIACGEAKKMKNAPEFQANLGFLWTANVGSGEISFGGDVAIEDESYALVANNGGSLIDPDPIVNARISYAPNGGNWNIALWGKNLTDEVYWKATTSPNVAYPIAPLTWGVDIRADF